MRTAVGPYREMRSAWMVRMLLALIPGALLGGSAYAFGSLHGGRAAGAAGESARWEIAAMLSWSGLIALAAAVIVALVLAARRRRGERAADAATTLLGVVSTAVVLYVGCWTVGLALFGGSISA